MIFFCYKILKIEIISNYSNKLLLICVQNKLNAVIILPNAINTE